MQWQFTPFAIPLFIGAAVMLAVMGMAWQRRSVPGAAAVFMLGLLTIIYSVGYAMEMGSQRLEEVYFWLRVEYIGIVFLPGMMMALVLAYTDHQRLLNAFNYLLILAIPAMTLAFAWTNQRHDLIWQNLRIETDGLFTRTFFTPGGWYWVQVIYFYLVVVAGIILLWRASQRARGLHRRQLQTLILSVIIPLTGNPLYLSGLLPDGLDINPYMLILTAIALAWSVFNEDLFDMVPVARDAVLTSMDDAVIVIDADNRVVYLNPQALHMADLKPEQALGHSALTVFSRWADVVQKYWKTPQAVVDLEVQGEKRFFDMRISPLRMNGQQQGRLLVFHDITDRIKIENTLKETNYHLTLLGQLETDIATRLDVDFVAEMALDAALRMTRADAGLIALKEEAQGNQLYSLFGLGAYPDAMLSRSQPYQNGVAQRVMTTGKPVFLEDVQQVADYTPLLPETRAQIVLPLLVPRQLIGVLVLESFNQEAFTRSGFELSQLLAAHTAVTIENARNTQEREKLVGELEAFAHTVAHDLKNPLGNIMVTAQFATRYGDHLDQAKTHQHFERVYRQAGKAVEIVEALLMLAGVRTQQSVAIVPLNMAAIIEEIRTRFTNQIDELKAEIKVAKDFPATLGYAPWVEEILANYFSNALKYGGRPPTVQIGWDEAENGKCRIWVKDNGLGLDADQQRKLFQPFTRLRTEGIEGHGLGLSIVQRIAERLNGEAGVESQLGEGSRFYFTLPPVVEKVASS